MPQIRDYSWNLEAATGDGGINIPAPNYESGDLLIAVIQSDTGTPTISATGWTSSFSLTNTTHLRVMYTTMSAQITSSISGTFFFSGSVNETYNGSIISIQDYDSTNPIQTQSFFAQGAASKYLMPTITCSVSNSLLLYVTANSSVGVPSLIEGPITQLYAVDGTAESHGVGWTIATKATPIAAKVSGSTIATGAGVNAVIVISPPSTGATIVPTICANDNSIYVDPLNGTTAFNGNFIPTGPASGSVFLFTGSIMNTTASVATLAAAADTGLNSFHSTLQNSTISASRWSGFVISQSNANVRDLSNKNILVHTGPSTPGQIQRLPNISSIKRGMLMGLRSSHNNWKMWYVHAGNTPYSYNRDVPLIVHPANTNGVVESVGSLVSSSIGQFSLWGASTGASTTATTWQYYSLWALDTVTIAGGNENTPVDITGIVRAASTGHERKSVIQQGTNQALAFQPLQFGDGGTSSIYLNLDSTAIEFPRIWNTSSKEINYCSIPNFAGITYYAGPSETIQHVNSLISSPSFYHWRIHPSASSTATHSFAGLSVIGAGDVQLRPVTTFESMTFSKCGVIYQNSSSITDCIISQAITSSAILCNDPNLISYCTFIGSGSSHALEITRTGSFNFAGNTFTTYGPSGSLSASLYNNSGGPVTMSIVAGGNIPTYRDGVGASTLIVANTAITLTGMKDLTEVRVFATGSTDELAGIEDATDGTPDDRSFTFSLSQGTVVDIVLASLLYVNQRIEAYSIPASDTSIPIQQSIDRNYDPVP
jgi:hypothetical protein